MHQAAVKSTNTGRPSARNSSTRLADQGRQSMAADALGFSGTDVAAGRMAAAKPSTAATPSPASTTAPGSQRRCGPRCKCPTPQAAKPTPSAASSSRPTASTPDWRPSTHTSHTAVANSGKASAWRSVTIHAPGRGRRASRPGSSASSRYGAAMPSPSAVKIASASAAGRASAKPSAAPMNGAVQGVATSTASTPVRNEPG